MHELRNTRHIELSDLTDEAGNVYDLTKELAGIAKQIKEDSKEDIDPPNPVLESIEIFFGHKFPGKHDIEE